MLRSLDPAILFMFELQSGDLQKNKPMRSGITCISPYKFPTETSGILANLAQRRPLCVRLATTFFYLLHIDIAQ
jgi:hypothetical protein